MVVGRARLHSHERQGSGWNERGEGICNSVPVSVGPVSALTGTTVVGRWPGCLCACTTIALRELIAIWLARQSCRGFFTMERARKAQERGR
jgi:hypothetical protein